MAVEQYRRLFEQRPKKPMPCTRLCITEDAGAGKSIFTHHLRSVLASEPGQAAFFGGEPGLVVRWEGREQTWPFDLQHALEKELAADARTELTTGRWRVAADRSAGQNDDC